MTVLTAEMPSSPVVALYAWVKTGSANEGRFVGSGITHFIEHMLFKGTPTRPAGVIPDQAKAMGGYINASTGRDHTLFKLTVPVARFDEALALLSDMLRNPTFLPDEVESERNVILKEMNMLYDKPERMLSRIMYKTVYQNHTYQHPIIGYEDIFKRISRENLLEYYQSYYAPNNIIFTVAGGIDGDKAFEAVKKVFYDYPAQSVPIRALPQEGDQLSEKWIYQEYKTDLTRAVMAYPSVPVLHKDLFALDVLAMALGSGESSRCYEILFKQKGLVESVSVGNHTPVDQGMFEIEFLLNDTDVVDVVKEVKVLLEDVKRKGLLPRELEKVRRQVMTGNIYARETAEGQASQMAMEEAFAGDYLFSEAYLEGIRKVTNDDVKRVAQNYLKDNSLNVIVLQPKGVGKKIKEDIVFENQDVQKLILSNGLKVLLREDHSLPVVSIFTVLPGGAYPEPENLEGLATLTAHLWSVGVKGKSSSQISELIEARGASVSSGSGRTTFNLSFQALSEDLPFALDWVEKFLKSPSFPEKDMVLQKERMQTAIKAREDSVIQSTLKFLKEVLFKSHPLRRDFLGTQESLAQINRKNITAYFQNFVSADDMVIAVFGDIDSETLKVDLEKRFGKLSSKDIKSAAFIEEPPESLRLLELEKDKEQAVVIYALQGPSFFDEDRYALEVAVNVLSSSLGGRMFKRIREELGKAYTLGGSFSPGVDIGTTFFYVMTTNENIDQVRSVLEEELVNMRIDVVLDKELKDAKTYLIAAQARSLQTMMAQGVRAAVDEYLGLGYDDYKSYPQKINAVTDEDVRRVAKKYLDINHAAVAVTRSKISP